MITKVSKRIIMIVETHFHIILFYERRETHAFWDPRPFSAPTQRREGTQYNIPSYFDPINLTGKRGWERGEEGCHWKILCKG